MLPGVSADLNGSGSTAEPTGAADVEAVDLAGRAAVRAQGRMKVHPIADLFPMMGADELKDFAEDITVRGQLQPIVVYQGEILDGRNRYAACLLAGVEPRFEEFDGTDPVGYILAGNMARRHMSKGQRAMIIARVRLETKQTTREAGGRHGVSAAGISQAGKVIKFRNDLVNSVTSGSISLDAAYKYAQESKAQVEEAERLLAELRIVAPDLADQVVDGELAVGQAVKMWRDREDLRKRQERARAETATGKLCDYVWPISCWSGEVAVRYATNYDPAEARSRKITKQTLVDARKALDEIIRVWDERRLP
jgi:hypothetical protein